MTDELLTNEVLHNIIQDFKKKDLSMSIKWLLIKEMMTREGMSYNDAHIKLSIGKTTLHTYRRAYEMGEDTHKELLKNGWSESDIQNALKSSSALTIKRSANRKRVDVVLDEARASLSVFIHSNDYSTETPMKIKELQNVLNRILMRVEK